MLTDSRRESATLTLSIHGEGGERSSPGEVRTTSASGLDVGESVTWNLLDETGTLDGEDVVPGFRCPVADLFA